jgi:predicted RNA-binding protein with EMAP domain
MSQQARVTSVEALELFRSQLIVHLEKLTGAADNVSDEVMRTRVWLENDRRMQLEADLRKQAKILEMAQQELFSSRISNLHPSSLERQMAVRKAKQKFDETMEKLTVLKKWNQHFESEVEPLAKQVDKLRTLLGTDMQEAVAYLTQTIKTLDEYARMRAQPTVSQNQPADGGTTV